jgi:hypothetical protein
MLSFGDDAKDSPNLCGRIPQDPLAHPDNRKVIKSAANLRAGRYCDRRALAVPD